jgi:hypothetical protein
MIDALDDWPLATLGLERKVCELPPLDSYLATKRTTDPAENFAGRSVAASSAPQETRK